MGRFERVKYAMVAFNILICLSGLLLLAAVLLLLLYPSAIRHIVSINTVVFAGTVYIIVLSVVLLILGILGSVAAYRESRGLLMLFFMLILVVFMAELGAAISALLFKYQLTKEYFEDDLINYYTGDNQTSTYTASTNSIMISFECCGVNGPKDFLHTLEFVILNPFHEVPEACCKRDKLTADRAIINTHECFAGTVDFINNKGCFDLISEKVEYYLYGLGALNIWILIIEIFVMIFAIWLYQRA
ncbi:tetraspanin-18-like [Hemiscyllium ocellatum]|uniref:tetraspanin-18-like n=1 Tax=Hemiscyllium ocellatum TaxID=170820 RepID=UPI0029676D1A|nr:tetraspanin-18-like [Hemiscyllium ocellatum]XP_060694377.1 tetraspanin-18-like [Hemiscyllium ocellatum]XP_060694378.1 tetraspanin-18-like [Hemiscyllium ocellatum]XP_060694379.1 tetraspanin-18-like [Hemiscyllium ocellatum]XP_060694380.1 tetraspanin-18-like [Hemiscyllium ocellatum]